MADEVPQENLGTAESDFCPGDASAEETVRCAHESGFQALGYEASGQESTPRSLLRLPGGHAD